jgi:hypothetical protein
VRERQLTLFVAHECSFLQVELLLSALEDSLIYLKRDGEIAIIDGANSTMQRRDIIRNRVAQEVSLHSI